MGEKNGIPNPSPAGTPRRTSLVGREERDSQPRAVRSRKTRESSWERRTGFPTGSPTRCRRARVWLGEKNRIPNSGSSRISASPSLVGEKNGIPNVEEQGRAEVAGLVGREERDSQQECASMHCPVATRPSSLRRLNVVRSGIAKVAWSTSRSFSDGEPEELPSWKTSTHLQTPTCYRATRSTAKSRKRPCGFNAVILRPNA